MDDTARDAEDAGAHQTSWLQADSDSPVGNTSTGGRGELSFGGSGSNMRSTLIRVVEGEIIPRLLLAHVAKQSQTPSILDESRLITPEKLHDLALNVLSGSPVKISAELRKFRTNRVGSEIIYCNFFSPLFREILTIYENNLCTLEEMILGISLIDRFISEDGHDEP